MFKRLKSPWILFLAGLLTTCGLPAKSQFLPESPKFTSVPTITSLGTSSSTSEFTSDLTAPKNSDDPLGSPYPIPWSWILQTQAEFQEKATSGLRYYRSSSLISPDGRYAAYSRIQMEVKPELHESRVTSVLFLEDLQTGQLQIIRAGTLLDTEYNHLSGTISILLPVSWSENGDRLLLRQFEGMLSSSDATDYAVIWNRQTQQTQTINPKNVDYDIAVLLGWSHFSSDRVLFQAGLLGEENWSVWSVNLDGQTMLANQNEPVIYGHQMIYSWTGTQAMR